MPAEHRVQGIGVSPGIRIGRALLYGALVDREAESAHGAASPGDGPDAGGGAVSTSRETTG
ncbi:hypothetical protein, partial [Paenibacillus sp. 598K]|uniref:hypothetical protein n=1 Tax=Paenibacillus sp. 598K TaxID=1117987 RepID=UPI001C8820E7